MNEREWLRGLENSYMRSVGWNESWKIWGFGRRKWNGFKVVMGSKGLFNIIFGFREVRSK